jgi:hypothetical protein
VPTTRAERLHATLERLAAACADGSLDARFEANRVEAVVAHGSAVDPSVDDPHDLDVVIWCGGGGPPTCSTWWSCSRRRPAPTSTSRCSTAPPVSLVAPAACGRGLWERRQGTIAALQMRFVPQWWDTAWLRRLRLEQLAAGDDARSAEPGRVP